jgi:orotidine-5'-phosphate decarboxylase
MTASLQEHTPLHSRAAERILVALDTPELGQAKTITKALSGYVGGVKIGLEFFNVNGPQGVRDVTINQLPFFLDLKFHDIPNTVAGAIRAVVPLSPLMLNVHGLGGPDMLRAAGETANKAAQEAGVTRPLVLAVTVLTSFDENDIAATGQGHSVEEQAVRLARLAQDYNLDGVVCSPLAIAAIRSACGPDFTLVVPGIRPAGAAVHDQKAVATPAQAIAAGANYLVIGRAITGAADPLTAARDIAAEIESSSA